MTKRDARPQQQCKATVVKYDGLARYQWRCKRNATSSEFCTLHSPAYQEKKAAAREAKWNAKLKMMDERSKQLAEEQRRAAAYPRLVAALKESGHAKPLLQELGEIE